jgi:hypothetical protein
MKAAVHGIPTGHHETEFAKVYFSGMKNPSAQGWVYSVFCELRFVVTAEHM